MFVCPAAIAGIPPAGTGTRDKGIHVNTSRPSRRRRRWWSLRVAIALVACAHLVPQRAAALTPESAEVVAAVDRGLAYLEGNSDNRTGGQALVGLAFIKGNKPDHPRVAEAKTAIREALANSTQDWDIYSLGLCIIFLSELDPAEFQPEVGHLLGLWYSAQKQHGGWGYKVQPTGDTSMTQYAILGMWTAAKVGLDVPTEPMERVCNWLLRTQDPSGAFGYQGADSGGAGRVHQAGVRHSMAAAGLGSLYICQDFLGLTGAPSTSDVSLPGALEPVREAGDSAPRRRRSTNIDSARLGAAQRDGVQWFQQNYNMQAVPYTHYYLYAHERYESFRELAESRVESEPKWYNDGARYLLESQSERGSWQSSGETGIACDTAFAILFLLRSTKQSLKLVDKLGAGTLVGGRGMPADGTQVVLRDGSVVAKPLAGPAEELLKMIEDPDHPDHQRAIAGFEALALEADQAELSAQAAALKRLAEEGDPEARRAAVRGLARSGDLDHVPTLIYALTDPDERVFLEARDGLRFMSRKFDAFANEGVLTQAQRDLEVERWKTWYLSIRPDAQFDD